jgi:hypothetical protein
MLEVVQNGSNAFVREQVGLVHHVAMERRFLREEVD